jgi:hypothetical protein
MFLLRLLLLLTLALLGPHALGLSCCHGLCFFWRLWCCCCFYVDVSGVPVVAIESPLLPPSLLMLMSRLILVFLMFLGPGFFTSLLWLASLVLLVSLAPLLCPFCYGVSISSGLLLMYSYRCCFFPGFPDMARVSRCCCMPSLLRFMQSLS